MQVVEPQAARFFALLRRAHRLVGLTIVSQIDDPAEPLLLQLGEISLGWLI